MNISRRQLLGAGVVGAALGAGLFELIRLMLAPPVRLRSLDSPIIVVGGSLTVRSRNTWNCNPDADDCSTGGSLPHGCIVITDDGDIVGSPILIPANNDWVVHIEDPHNARIMPVNGAIHILGSWQGDDPPHARKGPGKTHLDSGHIKKVTIRTGRAVQYSGDCADGECRIHIGVTGTVNGTNCR